MQMRHPALLIGWACGRFRLALGAVVLATSPSHVALCSPFSHLLKPETVYLSVAVSFNAVRRKLIVNCRHAELFIESSNWVFCAGAPINMNIFRLTGDLSHLAAIIILLLKIWKTRSCAGKSVVYPSRFAPPSLCRTEGVSSSSLD